MNIKETILKYIRYIPDILIIVLIIVAFETGYWYIILITGILWGIYLVWKGWSQVQLLMNMIDGVINKYKAVKRNKELKRNGIIKVN